jgi:porphobilinogen synthase
MNFSSYGVGAIVLFPMIDQSLKSNYAEEAYNPLGLVPRAIRMIKEKYPDLFVITDVALDPYSDQVWSCEQEAPHRSE